MTSLLERLRAVPLAQTFFARLDQARASALGRRLVSSTLWAAAAEGLSRGLLAIALVFVARALGRDAYGQFGIVRTTIGMLATVGGMGLGLTANRFVAEHRDRDKAYSGQVIGSSYLLALLSGGLVAAGLYGASGWLATSYFREPGMVSGLRIGAALLLLGAVNGAQVGILQGLDAYRRLAATSLLQGLVAVVALIGGAHWYGLAGALGGLLLYAVAGALVYHAAIRREVLRQTIPITYHDLRATLPLFWRFSLPLVLAGVAIAPLKWFAEGMLARMSGFEQLGLLHAAMIVTTVLIALVSTVHAPLISLLANATGAAPSRSRQSLALYGSWYACLVLVLPIVLFPGVVGSFFGAAYASAEFQAITVLLMVYCALMMYAQGIVRLIALDGSMWFSFHLNVVEGVALFGGFLLLAHWGALGLAAAYALSYLLRSVVAIPLLLRRGLVTPGLLFDRGFLWSLAALLVLAGMQLVLIL